MKLALSLGFLAFTLLAITFIWSRMRLHICLARLLRLEEEAASQGLLDEET
jgi:hypothetical protein